MKRIMNAVAVQTLLYTMKPTDKVEIFDHPEFLFPVDNPWNAQFCKVYTVDDLLHKYENEKIARARIGRTGVRKGRIFIMIDTSHEQY